MFKRFLVIYKYQKNKIRNMITSANANKARVIPINPRTCPATAKPRPLYFSGFLSIFLLPALLKINAAIHPKPPIIGIGAKPNIPNIKLSKLIGSVFFY